MRRIVTAVLLFSLSTSLGLAASGTLEKGGTAEHAFEPGADDLKTGMVLPGIVTNVTKFGAFVDVGVHQDGLVHVSELAGRFIKDPAEVVSVGQKVRVKVISLEPERKRIGLSVKQAPR